MAQQKVLVIVGPTASGKSDLAVRFALSIVRGLVPKYKGVEIISADSRQVYKGLNIGTGKITKKEMQGIPHHLLSIISPDIQFSASDFILKASEALRLMGARKVLPIVVGGTGLYIDALTGRINFPDVAPNQILRDKLGEKNIEELFKMLEKSDPERAKTIDRHNKVRLIRALEIVAKIGSVPQLGSEASKYKFVFVGLRPDDLDKRIYKRLLNRLSGMILEGRKLHKQGLTYKRMHQLGLEYRYVALLLQKKISKKELREKLFIEIRRYAKRQMVWFKQNKNIKWFKNSKEAERYILKIIKGPLRD